MSKTVLTFGTYDVFHVGHLRLLRRAAELGDRLVVGVSADALNVSKKGRAPVFTQDERMEIVAALEMVDDVFVEESLDLKRDYLVEHGAREVVLTGVDITSYGADLPRTPKLGALVKALLRHVPELDRLRISSIDSVEADPDLLDALLAVPILEPVRIAGMTAQLCHLSFKCFEELDERTRGDRRRIRPAIVDLPVEIPTEPHDRIEMTKRHVELTPNFEVDRAQRLITMAVLVGVEVGRI